MATFAEQVASLTGPLDTYFTSNTYSLLDQALTDGARDVVRRAINSNPEDVWLFTKSSPVTSSGLTIDSGMIYDVSRGNKPCEKIPPNLRYRATEKDSIYYATSEFPVYYLLDSKVFVAPEPGAGSDIAISAFTTYDSGNKTKITATAHGFNEQDQVTIAQSDTVSNDSNYIGGHYVFDVIDANNFIIEQDFVADSVTGYTVSEPTALCQHLSSPAVVSGNTYVNNFPQQYYSAVVAYGAIVVIMRKMGKLHTLLPQLTMPVGPVAPTLQVVSDDIPTYEGPNSLVLPSLPSSEDIDFSGISAPSFSAISSITLPTLSFDVSSISVSALDLGVELPAPPESPSFDDASVDLTVPRQNAPTYTKPVFSVPSFPSIQDIVLPAPPANIDLGSFSAGTANQAGSDTATYIPPALTAPDWSSVDTSVDDEDIEVATIKLQKIQAQVSVFQGELTNATGKFNEEFEIYKRKCDEAIQNATNTLTKEQNEKQLILAKHSQEVQVYQADVTAAISKWEKENLQVKYTEWVTRYQNGLQQYQTDISNELNSFNKEVQIYQAELTKSTTDATNKQNSDVQEYQAKISKYSAEVQAYQAKTSHTVAEWQQKIVQVAMTEFQQKRQDSFQEWSTQMQTDVAKYNADVQNENTKFQSELSVYQQKITKALSTYQAETGYDISRYTNELNAVTGAFQAELSKADAKFKNDIDSFVKKSAEIRAENQEVVQDYQAKMQYWTTESSNATSAYTTEVQGFGQEYTWLVQKLQSLRELYESMFMLSAEAQKQRQQGVT